jgi:UDP-glucose 4-epimerase
MGSHSGSEASSPPLSASSSCSTFDLQTPLTELSELYQRSAEDVTDRNYIVVVGGLGYIGSHTCLELLKAGHNIIIIDNLSNSYRTVYEKIELLAKRHYDKLREPLPHLRLYEADYRDQNAMKNIFNEYVEPCLSPLPPSTIMQSSKIRGVIHFGGYKSVSESIQEPLKYYSNSKDCPECLTKQR